MASLKDIRRRISSVKNTQKITRAMKMVAAAKLRRSQQALMAARPYADHMANLVGHLAVLESDHPAHPLLVKRDDVKRVRLLVLTSDRGFCGGFNGNLLRRVWDWMVEMQPHYETIDLHVIGRKGREFLRARSREPQGFESDVYDGFGFGQARHRAEQLVTDYEEGKFDECHMVYNRFKSAIAQEVMFQKLVPIEPVALDSEPSGHSDQREREGEAPSGSARGGGDASPYDAEYIPDYIYEPIAPRLLEELLPRYLATDIFRNFLESIASEFGARMVAMEAATNNCSDMIDRLTLTGNRLRQAAITSELMDIVNGAEALK